MERLKKLAENSSMFPEPSVWSEHSIIINAPRSKVWEVATNVNEWPNWHAYLKNAKIDGEFKVEAKISYGGLIKHKLALGKVRKNEEVVLYGTFLGFQGLTQWVFEEIEPGVSKVIFVESTEGPIVSLLYSNEKLKEHLQKWLAALKSEAEKN